MSQTYDSQQAQESSPESGERHQIIVKEFPDSQSGLLVEVYHYRANVNNCVRSASTVYAEDGHAKDPEAGFLDGHTKDVFVDDPSALYAGVYEMDDEDGYRVEVGEGNGQEDPTRTVLFARTYREEDLGLTSLDEFMDE